MDDTLVRLSLLAGALVVALGTSFAIRMRGRDRPRSVHASGLRPGFYLFTSSTCSSCRSARHVIRDALGDSGFTEFSWEASPGEFHRLGVGAVPAAIVVREDGSAMLFPGQPARALRRLSP